jgi:peptidoglycan-associated lipoprotein
MANKILVAALLIGSLAVTACNRPDRFGDGSGGPGDGGLTVPGTVDTTGLGGPNDPTSPAYFNQTIGDRVFFLVDQSTLTPQAQATLTQQVQWLQTNPDYAVVIEGHADEQGTETYNVNLSERRANAVREYMISQGLPASRIVRIVPYGKTRPVAVCSDESCYGQNRRAVTVITVGGTS